MRALVLSIVFLVLPWSTLCHPDGKILLLVESECFFFSLGVACFSPLLLGFDVIRICGYISVHNGCYEFVEDVDILESDYEWNAGG